MIKVKIGNSSAYLEDPKTVLLSRYLEWMEWVDENQPSWWDEIAADEEDKPFIEKLDEKQKIMNG